MKNKNHQKHIPVLLNQVVDLLNPKLGERYLDGTAGYGGHAKAIIEKLGHQSLACLIDQDDEAIVYLRELFPNSEIIHNNFLEAAISLALSNRQFDVILLDLGVSSPQFDSPERGFSFKGNARLDMRMDQGQDLDAYEIVNNYKEAMVADILFEYGEERRSRAIAKRIVQSRPIVSTGQLADIIRSVVGRSGDIDPATRSFQALRIAVNRELQSLEHALPILVSLLAPAGRIAVISFHSLEDRIVKQYLEQESRDCICPPRQPICNCSHTAIIAKLTKKPVLGKDNDVFNPRARSATLRAAVKLKPKQ